MTDADVAARINALTEALGECVVQSGESPQVSFVSVAHLAIVFAKHTSLTQLEFIQYMATAYDMTQRMETTH